MILQDDASKRRFNFYSSVFCYVYNKTVDKIVVRLFSLEN